MKFSLRRVLVVMLFGVLLYGGYAVYSGLGKVRDALTGYAWWTFAAACALAFGNYILRFLKWEFYLSRLDIRGVKKLDSFLVFLSGFVLTISPGKVGEVFKSFVLHETYEVEMTRTAPIIVAERVTDVLGIVVLIVLGSLGFEGGLIWAGVGAALVITLIGVVMSQTLSLRLIGFIEVLPGPFKKIGAKARAAYVSLRTLLSPRNLVVPTLISLGAWTLECLALWIIVRGFGEPVSVPLAMFFYATSTLAGAIIPVPGGLGVTETLLNGQMHDIGHVSPAAATGAMMLVRFATLWFAVLVGFVALTVLKRRFPGLLAEEAKPAEPAPQA
ncbi:MAG TPA: lysylphosphatidylglycerol synthase transmembrane domain-containing protein [Polyangiaceae bacterium]|jgi:uncharacterized membrane protein YbhN (UPF0104 family)|nr:lysylphosphatidylglycerol synthase transmembrane domain-containing protein [Polyangiaceae bacterium]